MLKATASSPDRVALAACVVYEPIPVQAPSTYDRAWAAAHRRDAGPGRRDQRPGSRGGSAARTRGSGRRHAVVRTRPDGRVQVEFNATGTSSDPGLVDRISASYNRRMVGDRAMPLRMEHDTLRHRHG